MHSNFCSHTGSRIGLWRVLLGLLAIVMTPFGAGDPSSAEGADPEKAPTTAQDDSFLERIWSLPVLHKDRNHPIVQEVSIFGRFQFQHAEVWSDQGDKSEREIRRLRLGAKVKILRDFELKANVNLDPEGADPLVQGLDEATLSWTPRRNTTLTLGKQKPKFTYEYTISSRDILTFERSLLVNQIIPDKNTGVALNGQIDKGSYTVGVWAGDSQDYFSEFSEGLLILTKVGYDISRWVALPKMTVFLDYLYSSTADNSGAGPYRHALSLSTEIEHGPFGVAVDFMLADGQSGVPDVWGVTILPTLFVYRDRLQLVTRYQYAEALGRDGLRVQKRYERIVPNLADGGRGERYHAVYAGLNWYIFGHKLKLMSGVEYANMDGGGDGGDFDGWTWFSGVRLDF